MDNLSGKIDLKEVKSTLERYKELYEWADELQETIRGKYGEPSTWENEHWVHCYCEHGIWVSFMHMDEVTYTEKEIAQAVTEEDIESYRRLEYLVDHCSEEYIYLVSGREVDFMVKYGENKLAFDQDTIAGEKEWLIKKREICVEEVDTEAEEDVKRDESGWFKSTFLYHWFKGKIFNG